MNDRNKISVSWALALAYFALAVGAVIVKYAA